MLVETCARTGLQIPDGHCETLCQMQQSGKEQDCALYLVCLWG